MRRPTRGGILCTAVTLVLIAAALPAWAQAPAAPSDAGDVETPAADMPRIEFEALDHDFGEAQSGAELKTTFAFRNAGAAMLVIQNVKGG